MKHNNCKTNPKNNFSLDSFFDEVLGNFEGVFGRDMNPISHKIPNVNIIDSESDFTIEIAAPGWNKSDFNISLDKSTLTVEAKKEKEEAKEGEKFIRQEFSHNSLKRSFNLPDDVDKENISAKYVNGILSLGIPKIVEPEITHKIEIK